MVRRLSTFLYSSLFAKPQTIKFSKFHISVEIRRFLPDDLGTGWVKNSVGHHLLATIDYY